MADLENIDQLDASITCDLINKSLISSHNLKPVQEEQQPYCLNQQILISDNSAKQYQRSNNHSTS